ncbi:MAG TPA: hypothetical protein PLU30_11840 [Verrucomicrobiae bacterium]|nr:hypothetical protein [Verrucomicrobiae bacterium]
MKKCVLPLLTIPLLTIAAAPAPGSSPEMVKDRVCLRIQLGLKDTENTKWDGSIQVSGGKISNIEIWRKGVKDAADGASWRISTRPAPRFRAREQRGKPIPVSENGVIVTIDGANDSTEVNVTTAQGNFAFKLSDTPYGKRLLQLEGRADVVRVPPSYQIAGGPDEEDFPSAALAKDGTVYVAYVAFTHGPHFARAFKFEDQDPEQIDISYFNEPTGGDRVWVVSLRDGRWSEPAPLTPGNEDVYKTATAVDGDGKPWVFWSAQKDGNFDLWASCLDGASWKAPVRLTSHPDPDINPTAATDSKGRVWVAWQAFRADSANILAARQQGSDFSKEITVSADPANEWDPAITTSASGDVAVVWDSYARGSYDVFARVAKGGEAFGDTVPVAASAREELHPSAAYDAAGRLWVAYEEGPELWGKDWGATDKFGIGLYGGPRTIQMKCFEGGDAVVPTGSPDDVLLSRKAPATAGKAARKKGAERQARSGNPESLPRLTAGSDGRIWLAYRSKNPVVWCKVGFSWFEYVACYEGNAWKGPIYVHNSDNILENRPALVALPRTGVLLITAADGRQKISGHVAALEPPPKPGEAPDPVNNNLFAAEITIAGNSPAPAVTRVGPENPAEPLGADEREQIARCRAYRMSLGGRELRLMRGEFHRHTELSTDGGNDGSLIDMYRYALDAVGFDWVGNGDHDNNSNREYPWWITQKTADAYRVGSTFMPMFSYERSVSYPDGHRNPVFAKRGIRTLPRLGRPGSGQDSQQPAHTPDTLLLYRYLKQFNGICASHTSGTDMGTDWRDNDPKLEPVVEIFQGCRQNYEEPNAPRAPTEADAIGGWRPAGFVWNALKKGYRLGFESSSDHGSTHISYCSVWASAPTRDAIFAALQQRHVFGATDNIIADVRCGDKMMGDEFELDAAPKIEVHLVGTKPFKQIDVVKDNAYAYTLKPAQPDVKFEWTDMNSSKGTSYYYVRGEQEDGELVWASPMWITRK